MSTHVGSAFASLAPEDPPEIADYRLLARLGEGGMGTVYLSHTRGGQPVALKLIRREYAQDAAFRRRFAQEVAAARRVKGYHLVPVVDHDTTGELPWLASEFIPGVTLAEALETFGPLPVPAVFQLVGCAARALTAIHSAGVVHRDLKPSNVMLAAAGPYVIDFGIARATESTALTTTGGLIGTPQYMSPEHALGQPVGPASDLFSLGLIAAIAATGRHPYGEGGGLTVATQIANTAMRPPDLSGYPERLRPLLERCLTAEPFERIAPVEAAEWCEEAAGRPLRDVAGWLPEPLSDAVAQRTAEPRTPPTTAPRGTDPVPPPPSLTPPPAAPPGPTRQQPPPEASSNRRFVVAVSVAAVLAVLLVGSVATDWFSPNDSGGDSEASDGSGAGDGGGEGDEDAQDTGDARDTEQPDASSSPSAEPPEPEYRPRIENEPLEIRANPLDISFVDLDVPQMGGESEDSEVYIDTYGSPRWGFSTQTGISTSRTPEDCLRASRTNALPEEVTFDEFENVLPVGTLLCTETTEGDVAMLEITDISPAISEDYLRDVSTLVTVWEQG
ncbi:serine/threonine-protein kinase [Streptomyces sp. B6B3]|uniref:serine/threonine-protein kinase n=1 Tax=Streptomyces sp. B6B3 TaxID=3153570 RepID=UPI00325D6B2C